MRTVYELERAGAAAMILEDQVFPKRCGHAAGKAIIPLDKYLRKLECALEARQTSMVRRRAHRRHDDGRGHHARAGASTPPAPT